MEHIKDLIESAKIKDQDAPKIQAKVECLNKHWQDFKSAWNFDCSNLGQMQHYKINPKQRYVDKQQSLNCFAQKLTQLHHAVQDYVYPCWLDRLYQFIKTCLLKLYNCLFAGPRHISSEKVFISAAHSGYAVMTQSTPKKHNYFICQEKLSHNAMVLQEDLAIVENWQKASRLDSRLPKR